MDYRCEDGRFGCPQVAWQFQTHIRFLGVKEWSIVEEDAYVDKFDVRKPSMVSMSHKSEELSL